MNFATNFREIALYLFSAVLFGCTGHIDRTANTGQPHTPLPLPRVVPNCQVVGGASICNWIEPREAKKGSQPAVNMVQRVPGIML